ncbi:hypothetical protein [Chamaesiphon sp. VAR_48_metabat_403]|nr:hypothetical protein [Chamaesiphon sp. VAR_48_metabat_403]
MTNSLDKMRFSVSIFLVLDETTLQTHLERGLGDLPTTNGAIKLSEHPH